MSTPRTLVEKIWDEHVVTEDDGAPALLYIDLQLVHEVTSPQAFEGSAPGGAQGPPPSRPSPPPTTTSRPPTAPARSSTRVAAADRHAADQLHRVRHPDLRLRQRRTQGIVHVIGPELGLTQPGMTIVCGDSHTATHGAFGALAFGIGTSEVEHVLATQTLLQYKPKTLELRVDGTLGRGVTAKDLILYLIGQITTDGGTGYVIEYTGEAIRALNDGRADDGLQHVDRGRRPRPA